MPHFTKHFHERLFERLGLVLYTEEQHQIITAISNDIKTHPPHQDEGHIEYECKTRGNRFVVAYNIQDDAIMTVYSPRKRIGRRKFKKKIAPKLR